MPRVAESSSGGGLPLYPTGLRSGYGWLSPKGLPSALGPPAEHPNSKRAERRVRPARRAFPKQRS